jgi:hypothetical protein
MPSAEDMRRLKGQGAILRLAPDAPGAPIVTGRVLGTIEAADGLVVTVEPDGAPGKRVTVHYQHVLEASPAGR